MNAHEFQNLQIDDEIIYTPNNSGLQWVGRVSSVSGEGENMLVTATSTGEGQVLSEQRLFVSDAINVSRRRNVQ